MKIRIAPYLILAALIFAQSSHASPRGDLSGVEVLFMEGRYDATVSESDSLIDSGAGRRDELYYMKGLSQLKLKRFAAARESFDHILSAYPWSKRAFDARLGLGDSYLLEDNSSRAISIYTDIAGQYPSDKNIGAVYGRLGRCYADIGTPDKADKYFSMARSAAPYGFEPRQPLPKARSSAGKVTKAAAPAPDKGREAYSVQVGSFKNRRNAEKLSAKLASRGYDSYVTIPVIAGDKFYRVRVGHLQSGDQASRLEARLRSEGYRTRICSGDLCE